MSKIDHKMIKAIIYRYWLFRSIISKSMNETYYKIINVTIYRHWLFWSIILKSMNEMDYKIINVTIYRHWLFWSYTRLCKHSCYINSINLFRVLDRAYNQNL